METGDISSETGLPRRAIRCHNAHPTHRLFTVMPTEKPAVKIKNAKLDFFVLHIFTTDMTLVERELADKLAQNPDFFAATPVALNLAGIADDEAVPDFSALTARMRQLGLQLVGILAGSPAQQDAATEAGLGVFRESRGAVRSHPAVPEPAEQPPAEPELPPEPAVTQEPSTAEEQATATMVIDRPVRTGQRIYAKDSDLVLLAVVNAGAEVMADGDIHAYAPLRGRALAGARGNRAARIFAQAMEAELVSIAGLFQVYEDGLPDTVRGKPAQVRLEGDRLIIAPLSGSR